MKSGSIHHDGDRITHCDATPLVLATGRSPASAVFVRSRSTNLSRSTAPPRTHSRNRRRTLPWIVPRLATTFERRSNYSASSVRGPRIPIDRAYDIDALPTRGFLLWRLSNAGHFPAWRRSTVVGRHPKPFTKADIRREASRLAALSPRNRRRADGLRSLARSRIFNYRFAQSGLQVPIL